MLVEVQEAFRPSGETGRHKRLKNPCVKQGLLLIDDRKPARVLASQGFLKFHVIVVL